MTEDEPSDLADEFLAHALMSETQRYIRRGRVLKTLTDAQLVEAWVASFETWFDNRDDQNIQTAMDDAAAELRLRDIPTPFNLVEAKIQLLQSELEDRNVIDNSEELGELIDEFLVARGKPKQ
jgi:hypothetical protein